MLILGQIGQGLAYALVGVSVYITFRILNFPDLTVDGAFPVGGAVCAAIIVAGGSAEVSLVSGLPGGCVSRSRHRTHNYPAENRWAVIQYHCDYRNLYGDTARIERPQ